MKKKKTLVISHPLWQQVDFWSWNNEWIKKALSVGKREEQPNTDGNLLARRIVCIAVMEKARLLTVVKAKRDFFPQLVIDLIAFAVQYVPIGCSRVCVFPAGFGSNFRIMVGSVSGPGSTCKSFLGSARVRVPLSNKIRVRVGSVQHIYRSLRVREFLDPWRPLVAIQLRLRYSHWSLADCKSLFETISSYFAGSICRFWHCESSDHPVHPLITGIPLRWFESYLTGRSFKVGWGGEVSRAHQLVSGVPQGSDLGPLLFSINTTSLGPIIQAQGFSYYADVTHHLFQPDDPTVRLSSLSSLPLQLYSMTSPSS